MAGKDYIVIGNFGLDYDVLTNQFLDASTGASFHEFYQEITAVTQSLGLRITEFFNDMLVLEGNADDRRFLERYFGEKLSFAFIDSDDLYLARECEYGTYVPEDNNHILMTSSAFPHAKSEIIIRPKPKPGMRYDA